MLVIQALRYLGNDGISAETMQVLSKSLSPAERKRLLKTTRLGVDWIYGVAKELTRRA